MKIKNLGPIKECEINLGQQTILMGKNNSGKTYISYIIYGLYKRIERQTLKFLKEYLSDKDLNSDIQKFNIDKKDFLKFLQNQILDDLNNNFSNDLPAIFNTSKQEFKDTSIIFSAEDLKDHIARLLNRKFKKTSVNFKSRTSLLKVEMTDDSSYWKFQFDELELYLSTEFDDDTRDISYIELLSFLLNESVLSKHNIVYIPAERNGINVFRNELTLKRSNKTFELEDEREIIKYPIPIADYMKYLTWINFRSQSKDFIYDSTDLGQRFAKDILKGKYEIDENNNEIYYREIYSSNENSIKFKKKKIPLQISSSSTKSLYGLEYYVQFLHSEGDLLIIDEPEMNLDPQNQKEIAELLIDLSRSGVKLIISTHSDYLVRATTNKLLKLKLEDKLDGFNTVAYNFSGGTVKNVGDLTGIEEIEIFDKVTVDIEEEYFLLRNKLYDKYDNWWNRQPVH